MAAYKITFTEEEFRIVKHAISLLENASLKLSINLSENKKENDSISELSHTIYKLYEKLEDIPF